MNVSECSGAAPHAKMWRGGPGASGAVGVAPPRASEGVGAAGVAGVGGVGGVGGTTTSLGDHHKGHYDSHNDSGFLSGSNLVSSSSLGPEDAEAMRYSEAPRPPPSDTKGGALSPTRLDSGIDISDQLSSLHLASPSTSTSASTTSTSELGDGEDTTSLTSRPAVTPPPRRSRLGLSEAQVALLQEIFKRDEDGDT